MSMWNGIADVGHRLGFVTIGRWRTRYVEAGEGPALILLHGTGGHLEAYSRNFAALAQTYRVIAYDLPGHGYTTLADRDLEIVDYVEHLEQLMNALNISSATLCGESLGGWVAAKFGAQHPDRVGRLVLNTPGGTMATPEVMEKIRTLSQAAADNPTDEKIRARLEWLMADSKSVTDELVKSRQAIYARPGFADSMRHILCLQQVTVRQRNLLTEQVLASIAAPTTVIWTSDDPSGPASTGMEMAASVQSGSFHIIDEAGHWPQWEQPEVFNELVGSGIGASRFVQSEGRR